MQNIYQQKYPLDCFCSPTLSWLPPHPIMVHTSSPFSALTLSLTMPFYCRLISLRCIQSTPLLALNFSPTIPFFTAAFIMALTSIPPRLLLAHDAFLYRSPPLPLSPSSRSRVNTAPFMFCLAKATAVIQLFKESQRSGTYDGHWYSMPHLKTSYTLFPQGQLVWPTDTPTDRLTDWTTDRLSNRQGDGRRD